MLENTTTVSVNTAANMIAAACLAPHSETHNGKSGALLGLPGHGKSAAFVQAAKQLSKTTGEPWQVVDIRALLYDPVELAGINTLPQDGSDYAQRLNPDWTRGLDVNGNYLIVFEEATKALQSVQNALYQAFYDRRMGQFTFGKNWVPFLTGNLVSSKSGDNPIPGALRNRFWSVVIETGIADWLPWAQENNLHPFVTTFYKQNPDILSDWNPETDPLVFSSPRSAESLSHLMTSGENAGSKAVEVARAFAVPTIGQEAGIKFTAHCEVLTALPEPEQVFSDPQGAPVPEDTGTAFYAASMLAYWAERDHMEALCTYARRCPHEVAITMVSETVKRHPECKETASYIAFIADYDPQQS